MKKCDTCIYRNENEYHKPCIVYRDDCEYYKKERGDMTREEELDWLCRLRSEIYVYMPKEWLIPMNNSLDMAIKALEQEPCGETVSLEAFKQVMWERDIAIGQLKELGYGFGQKIEPKTGHWEWLTEDKYRCSNCNHETRVDECMNEPMYDYCPFCGADMRGDTE